MYANHNQTVSTNTLQTELSHLQNHLLRFKLLIIQTSTLKTSFQSETSQKYSAILEDLQTTMMQFCNKYEQELSKIRIAVPVSPFKIIRQSQMDQKYLLVLDKIKQLENSLIRTQLNENKLIEAINSLMAKYQIYERPPIIQNDQYLRNRIETSQVSSIITFQPNHYIRQVSIDKSKQSRQHLSKTIKRNQSNIYLFRQNHNQAQPHPNRQFLRTFSKPNSINKISLRQVNGGINYQNKFQNILNPNTQRSSNSKDRRYNSVDRNDHRLKFMMNKLHD